MSRPCWKDCIHEFTGHWGPATAIAFSPDAELKKVKDMHGNIEYKYVGKICSGSGDKTIKLWNLETMDVERTVDKAGVTPFVLLVSASHSATHNS